MNMTAAQIKATLVDKFKRSEYPERVRRRIEEIKSMVSLSILNTATLSHLQSNMSNSSMARPTF